MSTSKLTALKTQSFANYLYLKDSDVLGNGVADTRLQDVEVLGLQILDNEDDGSSKGR